MSVQIHYFKTWPEPWEAMRAGDKTHEIRVDDRAALPRVGDVAVFREYDPVSRSYTCTDSSRELRRRVTYVSKPGTWGLPARLYVMSLSAEVKGEAAAKTPCLDPELHEVRPCDCPGAS